MIPLTYRKWKQAGFYTPLRANANKALLTVCGSGLIARGRKHVKAPFNRVSCCIVLSGAECIQKTWLHRPSESKQRNDMLRSGLFHNVPIQRKKNSQAPSGGFLLCVWRMRNAHFSGILRRPLTRQLCVRLIWPYFWDLWHFYGLSSNTVRQGLEKKNMGAGGAWCRLVGSLWLPRKKNVM